MAGKIHFLEDRIYHKEGDNAPLSSAIDSTTLKSLVPQGYYDGVNDNIILTDADFIAGNFKETATIFGKTGTIPVLTVEQTPLAIIGEEGKLQFTPPAGYYDSTVKVASTDANLLPENIKDGVSIFGVEGTLAVDIVYQLPATGQATSVMSDDDGALQRGRKKAPVLRSTGGKLFTCGEYTYGKLGLENVTSNIYSFTQINSHVWKKISVSKNPGTAYVLALDTENMLYSWGYNGHGQLGIGSGADSALPVKVGVKEWKYISAGWYHSLAIDSDDKLWAWGSNYSNVPTQIGTKTWSSISAGQQHSLAIDTDGLLWAWGTNSYGQLGIGDNTDRSTPTQVGEKTWSSISASQYFSLAVDTEGILWASGVNSGMQLGIGSTANKNILTIVDEEKTWSSISAGLEHSLAIDTNGKLWAWGVNSNSKLGIAGSTTNMPVPVKVSTKTWSRISAGTYQSMGIDTDGLLWSWGHNGYGEAGLGDTAVRTSMSQVGEDTWSDCGAGGHFSVAINNDKLDNYPSPLIDNLNNTLTDTVTGLTWIKDIAFLNTANQETLVEKGTWTSSTAYIPGDFVSYPPAVAGWQYGVGYVAGNIVSFEMGGSYRCILDHTSDYEVTAPEYGNTWQTYWESYSYPRPADWANGVGYTVGQEVYYSEMGEGKSYICTVNHTSDYNNMPYNMGGPSSSNYWATKNSRFVCILSHTSDMTTNHCHNATYWAELPFLGRGMNWPTAMYNAKRMTYLSKNWIIPNLSELLSLVDYGKNSPSTDHPMIGSTHYWTSTRKKVGGDYGEDAYWWVHFVQGDIWAHSPSYEYAVILLEKSAEV